MYNCIKYILPREYCLQCGAQATRIPLCDDCEAELPRIPTPCSRCGEPLTGHGAQLCGQCLRTPPPQQALWAPFDYRALLRRLLTELKFQRRLEHTRLLSALLLAELTQRPAPLPDLLLPVPLHPQRLRHRGYNQAVELARPLARALALPLELGACERVRGGQPQEALSARQRRLNLAGAFRCGPELAGRRVAIVDDVVTTGATAHALARALQRAGAAHIEVWAFARALIQPTANPSNRG